MTPPQTMLDRPGEPDPCEGCAAKSLWCLVSGGKDSLATARHLSERGLLAGVVYLRTGIGWRGAEEHVRSVARSENWTIEAYGPTPAPAYAAAPGISAYEALVLRYGFPGPPSHTWAMHLLKGRGIQAFHKAHPGAELASGVRRGESKRRFGTAKPMSLYDRRIVIRAPILYWSSEATWRFVRERGLEVSPAYQVLGLSGECACGGMAQKGEAALWRELDPGLWAGISALQESPLFGPKVRPEYRTWGWGKPQDFAAAAARSDPLEAAVCGGVCGLPEAKP